MNKTMNDNFTPKKDYSKIMHTTEHILNQTMVRLFGCVRSFNAHIEAKKSKCDYILDCEPTQKQIDEVITQVNDVIAQNLDVTQEYMSLSKASQSLDISKLPPTAGNEIRIVHVGDYDSCPCIGAHVDNTCEIGIFTVIGHDFSKGRWRIRWKILNRP
ncbi:MAG: hypothetical protein R3Y36_04850 [Spirochaetales bacterium]